MKSALDRRKAGQLAAVWTGAALLGLAACDTSVTNPGPVQDEFLEDPAAQPALVNGVGRAVAEALNYVGYTGAAVTREIHPSGSTGSFGITIRWQAGELGATDDDLDTHWENSQQARWLSDEAIRRIEAAGPTSQDVLAQAYLWSGYAYRLLGENMCEAVIDGGAPGPNIRYFEIAEERFERAAQIGTGEIQTAAVGGRASVRVFLGKWSEAVADAAQVPDDFVFVLPYFDIGEDAQKNRIHFATAAEPYKAHTVWNTVNEEYFLDTGDARVPFMVTEEVGDAAISCCGKVPWWPQMKYPEPGADIPLSTGREMRLIEAEGLLRAGDWPGAMAIINAIRADVGVPAWPASSLEEAWTRLKREYGIQTWLEGRRMGQRRRWEESNAPGEFDILEIPSAESHLSSQDLCFPTPPTEQDTNENVPKA